MLKKFQEFVNENIKMVNEGADWIILSSGNVALNSWSMCFMPLINGLPDMHNEITPDDPEYDEIVNKLNIKDRETFEDMKEENEPVESSIKSEGRPNRYGIVDDDERIDPAVDSHGNSNIDFED